MEFASPTVLIIGGTAAVLIPVLIQLFNRTRYQITQWAAMEFLLSALKKTRRRVRLENLLLLLLRVLVLLFVALMLSRPSIEGSVPLPKKTHLVVVLDNSYSMEARTDGQTAFERAKALIEQSITAQGFVDGSAVSLILTSETLADYAAPQPESRAGGRSAGAGAGAGSGGEGVGGSEEVAGETVAYDPQAEAVTLQRIETFRQQLDEAREALRLAEAALDDEQRRERPDAARLAELAEQVEAARDEAAKRADSLSSEQGTLLEIRRSAPEVLESAETVRVAPTTLFTTERETIVRKLREARISLVPPNWGTTFSLVRQALTASAETFEAKQVVIVTDLQARNFPDPDAADQIAAYREQFEAIAAAAGDGASGGLRFVDVGGFAINRTLVDARLRDHVVGVGVPLKLQVTVANRSRIQGTGSAAQNTVRLRYAIDGGRERDLPPIENVRPGDVRTVELSDSLPAFGQPGTYVMDVSIDGDDDDLVRDNRRTLVVDVREAIEILAVDGDPGTNPVESELFNFELALPYVSNLDELRSDPQYIPKTIVRSRTTTVPNLTGINFFDYDAVLLANVAELPPSLASQLARYVQAGGSVIITLGGQINPLFYNSTMFDVGLMPVQLTRPLFPPPPPNSEVPGVKVVPVRPWHRSVRDMAQRDEQEPTAQLLTEINVYQSWGVSWPEPPPAGLRRILDLAAQPDDEDGPAQPLFLASKLGRGQVVLFTSSIRGRWSEMGPGGEPRHYAANNFPIKRSFVKFWYEMVYSLTHTGSDYKHLVAGQPYRRPISPEEFSQNNFVFPPGTNPDDLDNGVAVAVRNLTRTEREHAYRGELVFADTHELGAYTVKIFKQRDALHALVREIVDGEPRIDAVARRLVVERVTNRLLNDAEVPSESRIQALIELLTDAAPGSDEGVRESLARRLVETTERLLVGRATDGSAGDDGPGSRAARAITDRFAVNLQPDESDLRRLDTEMFARLHRDLPVEVRGGGGETEDEKELDDAFVPQRSRIWKFVAVMLLVFLAVEMLLAMTLTRRQR